MDVSKGAQKGQKRNSNSASIITEESLGCHKLQGYHGYYTTFYMLAAQVKLTRPTRTSGWSLFPPVLTSNGV